MLGSGGNAAYFIFATSILCDLSTSDYFAAGDQLFRMRHLLPTWSLAIGTLIDGFSGKGAQPRLFIGDGPK